MVWASRERRHLFIILSTVANWNPLCFYTSFTVSSRSSNRMEMLEGEEAGKHHTDLSYLSCWIILRDYRYSLVSFNNFTSRICLLFFLHSFAAESLFAAVVHYVKCKTLFLELKLHEGQDIKRALPHQFSLFCFYNLPTLWKYNTQTKRHPLSYEHMWFYLKFISYCYDFKSHLLQNVFCSCDVWASLHIIMYVQSLFGAFYTKHQGVDISLILTVTKYLNQTVIFW